jgi:hypothetical protein
MITCKSINVDCAMSIMRSGPLPPPSPGYPLGKPRNATITKRYCRRCSLPLLPSPDCSRLFIHTSSFCMARPGLRPLLFHASPMDVHAEDGSTIRKRSGW